MEIRNIAIIAHVDHGKTTLTDALMRQTGMVTDETVTMDSNALEKERGITIYAKNGSLFYPSTHSIGAQGSGREPTKINIVDTPGHADFGSEVERVLRSIDSVLLIVDAQEGPMPQTKFVLKKSLELGLKPIVVLNKIDKPAADVQRSHDQVLELFMDLGANDEQLNFTTVYAIGRQGIAKLKMEDEGKDLTPLLDTILRLVPPAPHNVDAPFRMQPFNLGYDNYVGRLAVGRVYEGKINVGDKVIVKKPTGETRTGNITKIFTFKGTTRIEDTQASAGDIAMIAGIADIDIGETICVSADQEPLPAIKVDEPTISLNFLVNNSPFAGREGKFVTNSQIRERLEKELEVNVGLKIDFSASDHYKVFGRGELHVAILLENMRREGFEIQVSQPQVIIKEILSTSSGQVIKVEPFEEVTVDVPDEFAGTVIEKLGRRKAQMTDMRQKDGQTRIIFEMPTRGLLGYRGQFVMDTRGEGILCSRVLEFRPYVGEIAKRDVGSMVSMVDGKALGFSLFNLQDRGVLYIPPATEVYEGMVIGNVSKGQDMAVNPIKGKQLTNMRASGTDEALTLVPPMEITLERGLEVMAEDEYLEITPKSIRLRKQYLKENERVRAGRSSK
ncbi:MAG: GTP-binding protein TypA [Candidatus Magasanikbacteria bacterium RIFCSPHIGHO2_01_FULL_41_23]|uniref:50S ribosomal subunit assembly factor BipA n=1 Tax=Candidatus Magasanikbacteria bacterium RIFCSPLOWO2_01_FULL_40_15 TaxID=1798686 RepID=A0A1F6N3C1_9BACT|nr:MAG: GTP-binding protein TypA [Candidatus Magasanikbacteria bacterium RIFCSPHIGHO2_01_FULL_41_23]OGH66965.1 MAG: GTP-binding protein TypA [Candidatus Magasanikbacteria bacterium RIFCSPHIGHO2_02_FULL_41_35]OGH74946.1 MAG: GTP-binding protein TypA [Candidatus Magasanikbacteria bacterium RIFCSPHIGHO2_12_FULL_41_16]OGH78248.1 MAG: GTP-binding protein TypA [Candidatus Magasanikbacteria bacterium RIFCSPLOWO2_01_FULL_40_15]